jgi:hypothetical protein
MRQKTHKTLLFTLLWTIATLATGQKWSEPVQISDMEGLDNYPEFCIDNNGVIHVVCTHAESSFYDHSVVYYSKSTRRLLFHWGAKQKPIDYNNKTIDLKQLSKLSFH